MSAADFNKALKRFQGTLRQRNRRIFVRCAAAVEKSIKVGSDLTGAPGQPVRDNFLRPSWQTTFPEKEVALISTSTIYATFIEDGATSRGSMQLRSKVGGFHSVKLTRVGWQRIVDDVVAKEYSGA